MIGRFKIPLWILPLAIAALVAVLGVWGNHRLWQTIDAGLRADLTATLDANVTALNIWTTNQTKLATTLAEEPKVRELALRILAEFEQSGGDGRKLAALPELAELGSYLRPRLSKVGYEMAHLVSTNLMVAASSMRGRMRPGFPVYEEHQSKFAELFASGEPVIITPFKPRRPTLPEPPGGGRRFGESDTNRPPRDFALPRRRGTNDFSGADGPPPPGAWQARRGDITLMQVAAPIRDAQGVIRGALALIINPDEEFSRIISVARSGASGETYAFDQHGLMISKSRFDEQLKQLGLVENRAGASSAVTLHLSDPGGDLTQGFKPAPAAATNLTHLVAQAVAGGVGVDVTPARDYRGVLVAGAWRWLPQHGFGVVTQVDAAEAYQALRVLRLLFVALFLLLLFFASGMFLFSYRSLLWRRRVTAAESKIRQLGQYTLEEKIGEGGMGVVYRARHAMMRRDTAVKLLLPDRADPAALERFEREVCLTCQLTHPNTIQVYDYGRTPEGVFYYAMELLHGLNLHELVTRLGPLPESRVSYILTQVCDALAEAHALGLVHRDIKPANIFLCTRGGLYDCVKVLDFGLVREYRGVNRDKKHLTGENGMVGTPAFMPPEALRDSARSDPRSDIYAVGALGYYLLTGQNVFDAESVVELYDKHLTQTPIPPAQRTTNPVSAELQEAILRCLEKEPNLRPQSVGELHALLRTSPLAGDWTAEVRTRWWRSYQGQAGPAAGAPAAPAIEAPAATLKIDFTGRV